MSASIPRRHSKPCKHHIVYIYAGQDKSLTRSCLMVMRYLEESRTRWQKTLEGDAIVSDLKSAVRSQGDDNPCTAGLRSVCWKVFLLFHSIDISNWAAVLADSRSAYTSLRDHFLKYLEHPDELGSALDPLDDDKNSPWNVLRQDEELRAEIMQDVERCMPEKDYFRRSETQRTLLDILFIFCKLNQDVGYRQGMHELLAPILWVLEQDAIEIVDKRGPEKTEDGVLMNTLNANFIEHDAFTIFSLLMQPAKSFYELGEADRRSSTASRPGDSQNGTSPIVTRSKRIHEVYLATLDLELADHLTAIEVLPQVFLIRWIRILFGREFPFESLLSLWDVIFAEDPGLDLIDLICVAMLLRIRWQLIEADYSTALALLLKYPFPEPPHGPQTFVEDAVYLRENFNLVGATKIIATYSGRTPAHYTSTSRPATPSAGILSPGQKLRAIRSPLPLPTRFLHQGGVEALLQGAAKGVFDRGERLGINKAVRDAVGEVKKNMQNLQAPSPSMSRRSSDNARRSLDEGSSVPVAKISLTAMEQRNKQLSEMLDSTLGDLRIFSSSMDRVSPKSTEALDIVIAKLRFIQVYLDDSSVPLPPPPTEDQVAAETKLDALSSHITVHSPQLPSHDMNKGSPNTDAGSSGTAEPAQELPKLSAGTIGGNLTIPTRPRTLMPTRSTLAQSSFAFMLEPDESSASSTASSFPKVTPVFLAAGRKPLAGGSREKAFLFGDEPEDAEEIQRRSSPQHGAGEEFNLGTISGGRSR